MGTQCRKPVVSACYVQEQIVFESQLGSTKQGIDPVVGNAGGGITNRGVVNYLQTGRDDSGTTQVNARTVLRHQVTPGVHHQVEILV